MNVETTHNAPVDGAIPDSLEERYLSVDEAAEAVGRHPETVRRWVREGTVEARPREGGSRRGQPVEVRESSLFARVGLTPPSGQKAPAGGGIFDPNWGPFTRDPFRRA